MRIFLLISASLLLASCSNPPIISAISDSSLTVIGYNTPQPDIDAKAQEGCGLYQKKATPISVACAGPYCWQKAYLFACR